jgi:septal ring factor EnvC (AmiA/AmiB activator)
VIEWRDLAMAVLSGLWVILSAAAASIWGQVMRNRDDLAQFERHVSDTYARRDHLAQQYEQLLNEIRGLRELVIAVIKDNVKE